MADTYVEYDPDDTEIDQLRKRLLTALNAEGTDDEVWPTKAVVCIEGTEKETGYPAFLWFTWDRGDDLGLASWQSLGLIEHMRTKINQSVLPFDEEPDAS